MRLLRIFGCIALAATGCGGDDPPDTLTCEWLAGPDNCWANTAALAPTCLPAQAEKGTISADNATCTYASGPVVTFDPPLAFPTSNASIWNFTIRDASGASCVGYEDLERGGTLTVRDQTVRISVSGVGMSITCPDGTSVQNADATRLLTCPASMVPIPGLAKAWSTSSDGASASISASLLTGMGPVVPLFFCDKSF